jgi:protocatechuate 3,4-dioxygenase alpha subunit
MTAKWIPSGSQTVGPYFRIGLQHMFDRQAALSPPSGCIELRGTVIDRDGAPVPDALLEFWSADNGASSAGPEAGRSGLASGFCRAATDDGGNYSALLARPVAVPFAGGGMQAPHFLVLFFARGLLRHLLTRVYLASDSTHTTAPVLVRVPAERRQTLVAQADESDSRVFHWNVVLQGKDETAFFAW